MVFFNKTNSGGLMDVIRCDEENYLVWKWHPEGSATGESKKENMIRWGSSIRVKEGSVAVFVYSNGSETIQDYIVGPTDSLVDTKNLPMISSLIGLAYNGGSPFQAEVYFINLANTIQMKFAVPYFDVYDSELKEFSVPVAVRGSFDFNIIDYQEFIKKHRLDNFSISDLQNQVRDTVSENVKHEIANAPDNYEISVIHLEKKVADIKTTIFSLLKDKLYYDYGITLKDVNLAAIEINKESDGYKELKDVTKKLTYDALKKRNKAKIAAESREIKNNQTIDMLEKAANKFVNIKENQFARNKKTQAEYSDVIENERAGKIGAIGGKLFRDIGTLVHGGNKKSGDAAPPPISISTEYNVAVDGKPTGPYDLNTLAQMAASQQLTKDSLVWKKGMTDWEKAGLVEDLKSFFSEMPPIPES